MSTFSILGGIQCSLAVCSTSLNSTYNWIPMFRYRTLPRHCLECKSPQVLKVTFNGKHTSGFVMVVVNPFWWFDVSDRWISALHCAKCKSVWEIKLWVTNTEWRHSVSRDQTCERLSTYDSTISKVDILYVFSAVFKFAFMLNVQVI